MNCEEAHPQLRRREEHGIYDDQDTAAPQAVIQGPRQAQPPLRWRCPMCGCIQPWTDSFGNEHCCRCHKGCQCPTPGKHPVGDNGVHEATTDEVTIRKWFRRRPDYSVAIATGIVSGIVVVDVDPRHGGEASLEQLRGMLRTERPQQVHPAI